MRKPLHQQNRFAWSIPLLLFLGIIWEPLHTSAQCEGLEGGITGLPATACTTDTPLALSGLPLEPGGIFSSSTPVALWDHNNGTATFDPAAAGPGQHYITYAWFNPQTGCQGSWTDSLWIDNCPPPVLTILQGCTCREVLPGDEGNATTLTNGQFQETIAVTASPGQTWELTSIAGFYRLSSPHPPASPYSFSIGDTLWEVSPGQYLLKGIHVDEIGYSLTVTNGTDTLTASNACTYPHPVMDPLQAGLCEASAPLPLNGNGNGSTGSGQFLIRDAVSGDPLVPNATSFDPAALGIGQYTVEYIFDAAPNQSPCTNCAPGCVQAVQTPVSVTEPPGDLTCNDFLLIALDGDCSETILPDLILEGSYPDYSIFTVHIFDGLNDLGNTVDAGMINQGYEVQITNNCNDNSCWGQIAVTDKWKPQFDCPDAAVTITCLSDPDAIPAPPVWDNCDSNISPQLASETTVNYACDDPSGLLLRVERKWTAVDAYGNQADPCLQVIEVQQPDLTTIAFPPDLDGPTALACQSTETDPTFTGFPTLDGIPLQNGENACQLNVLYEDILLDGCGNTQKILRQWTLLDWCDPNAIETHNQIIHLADQTPPVLVCPDTLVFSVTDPDCSATFLLPEPEISDNCSVPEVFVYGPDNAVHQTGDLIVGLPVGTFDLQWLALDDCGNSTACQSVLLVDDLTAPVAVCDEITSVSLDAVGQALLPAAELDDGSYDYCTDILFAARRMDDSGPYTDLVAFDCADVGAGYIQVELAITDTEGNVNTCMVQVEVEDKLAPELSCPPDTTLACTDDLSDPDLTGIPAAVDNCSVATTEEVTEDLDQCGLGTWSRSVTAVDPSGNEASCFQQITVFDPEPFAASDILWPEALELSQCDSMPEFSPDSLPAEPINYSYPQYLDNPCSLTGVSYEDAFFDISDPACFKVVRTWSVIDWCQFDPINETGIWTYEQTLKVVDNDPPDVFCAFDPFVKIQSPFCYDTVTLDFPLVTDCSPEIEVLVTSELGDGFGPFPDVPLGSYDVSYQVTDQCGNSTFCHFTLQVVDAKNPTPVCLNGLVAEIDQNGSVDVSIDMINLGSYDNCTAPEDLFVGFSWLPEDTVQTYTCADIGPQPVTMWVIDEFGNFDFCEITIFIQDNLGHCSGDPVSIAGKIINDVDEPVSLVNLELNQGQYPVIENNPDGSYLFSGLPPGGDFTLNPGKDINPLNGVTTYDALLISQHILGIDPLDSPYEFIAADCNNSGTITTLDALEIRKLVLQTTDGFTNNESWRFVDASWVFPNPQNPFSPPFPEVMSFNDLTTSVTDADFIAVKIGDLNHSAAPAMLLPGTGVRQGRSVEWEIKDRTYLPGERVATCLWKDAETASWQQSLEWSPEELRLLYAEDRISTAAHHPIASGRLLLAGEEIGPMAGPLLCLEWEAQAAGRLSDHLQLAAAESSEARTPGGDYRHPVLNFRSENVGGIEVSPNPTAGPVRVISHIAEPGMMRMTLYDTAGRQLWKRETAVPEGLHTEVLPAEIFPGPGLYWLRRETEQDVQSVRIIQQ